jgi:hypothetical protein
MTFFLARREPSALVVVAMLLLLTARISCAFQITPGHGPTVLENLHRTDGSATTSRWSRHSTTTRLYADGNPSPKKKNLKTFQRYLEIQCWKNAEIRELEPVLQAVAESCKQINRLVQRAQTDDLYGVALGKDGKPLDDNVQGEVQQQLDVLCNTIMLRAFCGSSSSIHSVASEEEDEPRCCSDVMVCRITLLLFCEEVF